MRSKPPLAPLLLVAVQHQNLVLLSEAMIGDPITPDTIAGPLSPSRPAQHPMAWSCLHRGMDGRTGTPSLWDTCSYLGASIRTDVPMTLFWGVFFEGLPPKNPPPPKLACCRDSRLHDYTMHGSQSC
jgi:hypothetical protein